MNEEFSVLIPDGESPYAPLVLHCFARFPRVRVHILSKDRWSPVRFSRYQHGYTFKQAGGDDDFLLEAAVEVIRKEKIDVFLPVDTAGISFAIANYEVLSSFVKFVPLPDRRSFEIANNKWLLAEFLEESQMPGPFTLLVDYDAQFEKRLPELQFPVLLKPTVS